MGWITWPVPDLPLGYLLISLLQAVKEKADVYEEITIKISSVIIMT